MRFFRSKSAQQGVTLSHLEVAHCVHALGWLAENGLFLTAGIPWDAGYTLSRLSRALDPKLKDSAATLVAATDQVKAAMAAGVSTDS